MSFYRTGTIALTNGSTAITGTGTDFINGTAVGECVQAPDGKLYEISTIISATGLTLGQAYLGSTASGQTYSIVPTQSYIRDLAGQAAALVNGFTATRDNAFLKTAADKPTPIDADSVALRDSVSGLGRLTTWANIKATLKAYLSGVAFPIGATTPAPGAFTTLSASSGITSTYGGVASSGTGSGLFFNRRDNNNYAGGFYSVNGEIRVNNAITDIATFDVSGNLGLGAAPTTARFTSTGNTTWIAGAFGSGAGTDKVIAGNLGGVATIGSHVGALTAWAPLSIQGTTLAFGDGTTLNKLSLDASGNLLIGATAPQGNGVSISPGGGTISQRHASATAGKYRYSAVDGNNTLIVYDNNNTGMYMSMGSTSWAANSDERLKTDLIPIADALAKVGSLRTVTGRYKTDEAGVSRSFFVAQDVLSAFPEAVSAHQMPGDEMGVEYLGVAYSDMTPLLAAAIKEQKILIDSLMLRLAALEAA